MANGYVSGKIDVKNKGEQEAVIEWDGGNLRAHLGGTKAVGGADNEFSKLVGGILNVNRRDNDIEDILKELLTGKTGGNAREDIDSEAGIAGVELKHITDDSFTITLENGAGVVDTLTFKGEGVAGLIDHMDTLADLGDGQSRFSVVGDGEGIIGTSNAFGDLVGGVVPKGGKQKINDLAEILKAGLEGDERVELLDLSEDKFTVNMHNDRKGTTDTIVFTGDDAAAAIQKVIEGGDRFIDAGDKDSEFVIAHEDDRGTIGIGGSAFNVVDAPGQKDVGGVLSVQDAILLAETADARDAVTAIDLGGSTLLRIETFSGAVDSVLLVSDSDHVDLA